MIELGRGEVEVVQAVEDQERDQRAGGADQRPRHRPDRGEGRDHRDLGQRVIEQVADRTAARVASTSHHGSGGSLS